MFFGSAAGFAGVREVGCGAFGFVGGAVIAFRGRLFRFALKRTAADATMPVVAGERS